MPRGFLYTLAAVNVSLAVAGAVYAGRLGLPASVAAPVVAAFLLQISFYLLAGIPAARRWLEERLRPGWLGVLLVAVALAPYLVYSLPTGVFAWTGVTKLAAIAAVPGLLFVVFPARRSGLSWQDLLVVAMIGTVELGKVFRSIYLSPVEGVRLDILGRFMILGVGAVAYFSLRRLQGCDFRLATTWEDWKAGVREFALFLPVGVAAGLAVRFASYRPVLVEWWMLPIVAAGTFLGIYLAVALFEELFLRGVLQNLTTRSFGHPVAVQAVVSVVSGLAHLPFREFPNWRFALLATLAHWFYGQAWRRAGLGAAGVTHALVVTVWRLWFSG
jgi:hypothetical protein